MKNTLFSETMALAIRLKTLPKNPKFVLILLVSFLFSHANAQNCSYKTNEVDKFTKKFTKITKPKKIIGTYYTEGKISIKRVDTSFFILFDYFHSSNRPFNAWNIAKSSQLIFLLENDEVITLISESNITGTSKVMHGFFPLYISRLDNVSYKLTKSEMQHFLTSKIKSIRFYVIESNGTETYVDCEIKNSNRDDIQSLVKCVL